MSRSREREAPPAPPPAPAGHERRYGVLYIALIGFGLWLAFQGTTKNGVVGCADMPGGDNWDNITRPLR